MRNIATLLQRRALAAPATPAIGVGNCVYQSYGQLALRAAQLGETLRKERGLQPGDCAAIAMQNVPEFFEVFWGCVHAGLTVAPLNSKLHAKEFATCMETSGARVVFTDGALQQTMSEALTMAKPDAGAALDVALFDVRSRRTDCSKSPYSSLFQSTGAQRLAQSSSSEVAASVADVAADAPAWLFFTSGTTGKPKAAELSHANLHALSRGFSSEVDSIAPGDCMLHAAPLTHGSGLYHIPHVAAGACNVVPASAGFEPSELLHELLPHWRGACTFLAPTMVHRMCEEDARAPASHPARAHLKTCVYAGGPMHLELLRRAMRTFGDDKFVQIYVRAAI